MPAPVDLVTCPQWEWCTQRSLRWATRPAVRATIRDMPLPTIHVNISGTVVAAYAAVVSSVTASVQIANFLRDRVRLKVEVMFNRQIIGDPHRDPKQTLIQVNVTNVGRRPITVTGIGVLRLYPCETHYVLTDINPAVPRELTEGKYVDAFVPHSQIVVDEIRSWDVSTSNRPQVPIQSSTLAQARHLRLAVEDALQTGSEKEIGGWQKCGQSLTCLFCRQRFCNATTTLQSDEHRL
jgi:hypothetical protein